MILTTKRNMPENDENDPRFSWETSLIQRGENSYFATVPQALLAVKSAPTGEDAKVSWRIDEDTGNVVVEFVTEGENGS